MPAHPAVLRDFDVVYGLVGRNGDGNADIVWQNDNGTPAVWLMDGTNLLLAGGPLTNPGSAWHII